jgi:putative F0F1-ATPase subunit (Ca2+/Mg2+ transporter)
MASYLGKRSTHRFDAVANPRIYSPGSMAGGPEPGVPGDSKDLWGGVSTGTTISIYLLSAVGVWGAIGFLIDRLAHTPKVFTAIGMVVGAVAGIYLIYLRYGKGDGHETR